ncbi:MAG: hypothetical protein GDA43_17860 [Hormoscilla sp. SP5CHS1]|nr:hypothetical protein [Hormoscilla sp. SP12CHS1]MBC6454832.1 hypothetical protein [Hormoscilla sp. SP5CHS1]
MDKNALTILQTDIQGQMDLIDKIFAKLEERAIGLTPDEPAIMESVAYQIHNLYNAVEDLLKIVAAHFENQITDTARWHSVLLQRMTQDIPGIRPRLLSESSYLNLNNLRGFRHFFRHAYGVNIDYEQLAMNLDKARLLDPSLTQDVENFLKQVTEIE